MHVQSPTTLVSAPIEVVLYGHLRKAFGRTFKVRARSALEAVRALTYVLPGFKEYVGNKYSAPGYHLLVNKEPLNAYEDLAHPVGMRSVKIVPHIGGSKKGGLGMIFVGAALIAFAVMSGGAGTGLVAAYAEGGLSMAAGSLAFTVGVSMALGGLAQLFAKSPDTPKPNERADNQPSYLFGGAVNTVAEGNSMPLLIGHMTVGSMVASSGISTAQLSSTIGTGTQTAPPTESPLPNTGDTMVDDDGTHMWFNGTAWVVGESPDQGYD